MATVMAIIIDNLQLKYRKVWLFRIYEQEFFHFSMKVIYNDATKNLYFKFFKNLIWPPLEAIIIDYL